MQNNKKSLDEPLVSIILPSYNHGAYIRQSIQSALDQTYKNIELIIVDDSSSDNSREVIESFDDERIRSYFLKKNMGGAYTTNYCIKHSRGEFVSVLNSDDLYYPQKIEKQMNYLKSNPKISAVFSFAQAINEKGEIYKKNIIDLEPLESVNKDRLYFLKYFVNYGNICIHPTVLIRKSVYNTIGLYDERLHQIPDFEYWVRVCSKYEIRVLPEKLIMYRFRDGEMNTSNGNRVDVQNRMTFEYQELLKNYFNMSVEDSNKVFGIDADENNKEFLIAHSLFSYQHPLFIYQSVYKLAALNKLFEIFKDNKKENYFRKKYDFSYSKLVKYTGKYQLYNYDDQKTIESFYSTSRSRNELLEIKNSLSWKLICKLRKILDLFLPNRQILKIKLSRLVKKYFLKLFTIVSTLKRKYLKIKNVFGSIFKKKHLLQKIEHGFLLASRVNIKNYNEARSKYILLLDEEDKIANHSLETLSFIAELDNLDQIEIINRKNKSNRNFFKKNLINKSNVEIKKIIINDDNHIITKWSKNSVNLKFIEENKFNKNPYQNKVANPFVNLVEENDKEGIIFVYPFVLHAPNHLTNKIIETFYKWNYNNFVIATEDIFPNYLGFGDGFTHLSKFSKSIAYLNEILPSDNWFKYFSYLIETKNIKAILNTGSPYFYKIQKKIKKNYPKVKIIDVQFNEYGHIREHFDNLSYIDTTIVESKIMKDALIKKGDNLKKVLIIPNGIDTKKFNPDIKKNNLDYRKKLGILKNNFIVSFIGRLSEEKNLEGLIKVAEKMKYNDDVFFIIAGDGPVKESIEKEIVIKRLTNIRLLGQQDPTHILSISNLTILTSTIDGSPMSIKESMSVGVPVISSNVGGIPELIINKFNGILLDHNNIDGYVENILSLKNDDELYEKFSKNSILHATKYFNEDKFLKKYVEAARV